MYYSSDTKLLEYCNVYYRIVGFFEYLNSVNGRFSVFSRFYFHEWVC